MAVTKDNGALSARNNAAGSSEPGTTGPGEKTEHRGSFFGWDLHGNGRDIEPGGVVKPEERLSWPRTIGVGMQHVIAMFGATLLVPTITGFPVNTTLLFSGLGTILFLLVTRNRLPSYLGSSFAFLAPLAATQAEGFAAQLGGIVATGALLFVVGLVVQLARRQVLDAVMPPAVTGAIVALIGLNLAPTSTGNVQEQPLIAGVTLLGILLFTVMGRGMVARLGILLGVLTGWGFAFLSGGVSEEARQHVGEAAWIGFPHFETPEFTVTAVTITLPVVVVLIAENVGHVKAVSTMTNRNLDDLAGKALMADGMSTVLAGSGGGSGTTTYAENIGVMAATKVYSSAAYWVAAATAIVLAFIPKFGAAILTIPVGVLGGATLVLYGMIGLLGVRIWMDNEVSLTDPVNLTAAAVAMIVGIGNLTLNVGSIPMEGIAWGSVGIILGYPVLRYLYDNFGEGRYISRR